MTYTYKLLRMLSSKSHQNKNSIRLLQEGFKNCLIRTEITNHASCVLIRGIKRNHRVSSHVYKTKKFTVIVHFNHFWNFRVFSG
jgi:hypothetical protein